ncbi:E3 ubiquitin- ligase RNF185-like [Olea europaea subsp. europaea]|nr:E3 ubiquitin- ligase RNF185-like [Olea europaea subsp. europaea]
MGGFGPIGGFAPMASPRFGNFTLSASLGGLFPSYIQVQGGFPGANMYGPGHGYPHGHFNMFHGGHTRGFHRFGNRQQRADFTLKILLLLLGFSVLMTLIWS